MVVLLCLLFYSAISQARELNIFAAASVKNALDRVVDNWHVEQQTKVVVSYASSSLLARQISKGAPADVFICANSLWMDWLEQHGHIQPDSKTNIVGNRLALVVPSSSQLAITLQSPKQFAEVVKGQYLVTGIVNAVPLGIYAKQALVNLGVWGEVSSNLIQVENARAALALVARAEASVGIVYQSDARVEPAVKLVEIFDNTLHDTILYSHARIASSTHPYAEKFIAFVEKEKNLKEFYNLGFVSLPVETAQ